MGKRSPQVARARGAGSRTPTVVAAVVVVLVAAVVIGGVLLSGGEGGGQQGPAGAIPAAPAPAAYATRVDAGVVVAGDPAPTTLEVWEDPLCPACQAFERRDGDAIARATAEGRVQVRYHLVNFLDPASRPAGYSSLAANAMMCAAQNGAFPAVHASLYAAQPGEGEAGWTTEQVVDLGNRAGAGPGYAGCVTAGTHTAAVGENLRAVTDDPRLTAGGGFGTPTVLLGDRKVRPGSAELENVLR